MRGPGGLVPVGTLLAVAVLLACGGEEPVTDPQSLTVAPPFTYPLALWDAGVEGETVVLVHVLETGEVDSVYVESSSGEAAFDSAAVAGAYELEFAPARRGDRRIAMWARVPVRFRKPSPGSSGGRDP